MKKNIIRDSKQLAYPKWKAFFDSMVVIGLFLLLSKLIILALNKFAGADITILENMRAVSFLPFALIGFGGIGSNQLNKKYKDVL
ncbi:hypothetical protein [Bacillus sp. FJAT-28004]|uniref:hypothetical protein n=1 Tax=Bacillus sp. FJAT-28004 TaxID=1679165 RepID=UPI0006B56F80|nr:hypothetical protein [Bacillus sp. FJAT-28004]